MSQAAIKVADIFVSRLGLKPETAADASLALTEELLEKIAFESDWDSWTEDTINIYLQEMADSLNHSDKCDCERCNISKRIESIVR